MDVLDAEAELAVRSLAAAARELPLVAVNELARRLADIIVLATQEVEFDLHAEGASRRTRYIGALRAVAELRGHAPSTVDYQQEYERRKGVNEGRLPARSSIITFFGSWPAALAAAGLAAPAPLSRTERRRRLRRKRPGVYPKERLIQCLRVCASDLGRTPTVRDYCEWREDLLSGRPGARPFGSDIPHHQTIAYHFGSWTKGLAAAGLIANVADREPPGGWSRLVGEPA